MAASRQDTDILTYCHQVKERLRTLDIPHKRLALEALDIRVTWPPGALLQIEGSILIEITVPTASRRAILPAWAVCPMCDLLEAFP